jgi:hypothetical protein
MYMRTLAALIAALALLAGCGEDDEAEPPAAQPSFADLVVEVDADGAGGEPPKTADVSCETADDAPCAGLTAAAFEPTPRGTACTQVFGGPEKATVTGTFDGKEIDAEFSRENGCEIARWEEAKTLLGAAQ